MGGQQLPPDHHLKHQTNELEELIIKLATFQDEFESPSEEDLAKVTPFSLGDSENDRMERVQHITEITVLTVKLIVEFSKRIPGFDTLYTEDQITLLKANSSEVMMLRAARKYHEATDSILFANNQQFTMDKFCSASMEEFGKAIFHFCRTIYTMDLDDEEYALLSAIVIFSESPFLLQPKKIEKVRDFYVETLKFYTAKYRAEDKNYFARLLSTLVELRSLGDMNYKQYFSYKVYYKKIPPLLEELWNT